jgi:cholesterol transport system auxiliary component
MKCVRPILLAAFLAACSTGQLRNAPPVVAYDFGLPAHQIVGDGVLPGLALEVRSPPWFESLNIDYRLNYDEPLRQREYSGSRWVGSPGTLLAQRLRQQLGIVGATGAGGQVCALRIELQEFSQIFDSPQQSHALLLANASLIDARRRVTGERRIAIEKAAATADAHGGVVALVAASAELGQALADWLVALETSGALKSCAPAITTR